jgi:asparagine N-glycosylation enzyme membrane subunit Stt3
MRTNFNMAEENITMIRGDSIAFNLVFVGEDHDITLGHAYFTAKKSKESTAKAFQKTLGDGIEKIGTGEYSITVNPEDTDDLDPGRYWYDFRVSLQGQVFTIMWGILDIVQEVAENVDSGGGDPGGGGDDPGGGGDDPGGGGDDPGGGGDEPVSDITEYHMGDSYYTTSTTYSKCPVSFHPESGSTMKVTLSYVDENDTTHYEIIQLSIGSSDPSHDTNYYHLAYVSSEQKVYFNSKNGKRVKIIQVEYETDENVVQETVDQTITSEDTLTVTLPQTPVTGTTILVTSDWNGGGKGTATETAGTSQSRLGIAYDGNKTLTFASTGTHTVYTIDYVAP